MNKPARVNQKLKSYDDARMYDILLRNDCIVVVINTLDDGLRCELIYDIIDKCPPCNEGIELCLGHKIPNEYKTIGNGGFHGWTNYHEECIVISRRRGKRPTMKAIVEMAKYIKNGKYCPPIKSVKGLMMGHKFIYDNVTYKVTSFPTKYTVCGSNVYTGNSQPDRCKVSINDITQL